MAPVAFEASLIATLQKHWPVWLRSEEQNLACPLCASNESKMLLLKVASHVPPHETLHLYHCAECDTCFFDPVKAVDYSNLFDTRFTAEFGIELGTGLSSLIRNVCVLKDQQRYHSLLDVGCGSGFLVDFARRVFGWDAAGVDLISPTAFEGGKILDAPLYSGYLREIPELANRLFDVVHASEVIEHVEDPRAFVADLRRSLTPQGVMVLTTPDADSITDALPAATLVAVLSPGYHTFLYTEQSLRHILTDCGFTHVTVQRCGHQLVAHASDSPFEIDHEADVRAPMLQYLDILLKEEQLHMRLAIGVSYRLLRERVNAGHYESCGRAFERLSLALHEGYDIAIEDCKSILQRLATIDDIEELGQVLPYSISSLLYFVGMYHLQCAKDYQGAINYFACCFESCLRVIPLLPEVFEEAVSIFWHAKYHEGLACLHMDEKERSVELFNYVLNHAETGHPLLPDLKPPESLIISCLQQLGMAHFMQGNYSEAIRYYNRVLGEHYAIADLNTIVESKRHLDLALEWSKAKEKSDSTTSRTLGVHYRLDNTWSDDYGVAVQGWMFGTRAQLDNAEVTIDGVSSPIKQWHARPDVAPFFPDLDVPRDCGFWVHVPRTAKHSVTISATSGDASWQTTEVKESTELIAPAHCVWVDSELSDPPFKDFVTEVNRRGLSVLEIGSRLVCPGAESKRRLFPKAKEYVGFDFHLDSNTDVAGDAHRLSEIFIDKKFDAVYSHAVFEHLAMPWVVALEIAKILNLGGITYNLTTFAWPEHDRPCDYWRFSDHGLRILFAPPLGFEVIDAVMSNPVSMYPYRQVKGQLAFPTTPGFAGASILARKVREIDEERFRWQLSAQEAAGNSYLYPLHDH